MSNCLFAYPDRTLQAALSGGSWQSLLPLSNLKVPELINKARTVDTQNSSTTWDEDLGSIQDVRVISLINHNASKTAIIRVRLSTGANLTNVVYDSGVIPFYTQMYPQGGLPYGHPDFWTGGVISDADLLTFPKDFYLVITGNYSIQARYARIEVFDITNPDGYFELSRCFIALAWQPGANMNYGASFGLETATTADTIPGGPNYYDIKKARRIANFGLEVNAAQGVSFPLEMQRKLDIHEELFFVYDPSDTTLVQKQRSFLCTMKELSPIDNPYFDANTAAYKLSEVL